VNASDICRQRRSEAHHAQSSIIAQSWQLLRSLHTGLLGHFSLENSHSGQNPKTGPVPFPFTHFDVEMQKPQFSFAVHSPQRSTILDINILF
jgi:hypothetical protein